MEGDLFLPLFSVGVHLSPLSETTLQIEARVIFLTPFTLRRLTSPILVGVALKKKDDSASPDREQELSECSGTDRNDVNRML